VNVAGAQLGNVADERRFPRTTVLAVGKPPPECIEDPDSCYPQVIPSGPSTQNTVKGRKVNDYVWAYDEVTLYQVCSSTTCENVGSVRVDARIGLNGRQSNWSQGIAPLEGPRIKGTNKWNCIDDNGNAPNTSCSGGEQARTSSTYRSGRFESTDSSIHRDDSRYWYHFDYAWKASGYPWVFTWRDWRSFIFLCSETQGPGECQFNQ